MDGEQTVEAVAKWNYVRISPRKARLVADLVRGMRADDATDLLVRTNKKAARLIFKVLQSAIANADNQGLDLDGLRVAEIYVNEGPRLKRMRAAARGRGAPYVHRTAHIVVRLRDRGGWELEGGGGAD